MPPSPTVGTLLTAARAEARAALAGVNLDLTSLTPSVRALLADGSSGEAELRGRVLEHVIEARVAERALLELGRGPYAAGCRGDDGDVAEAVLQRFSPAVVRGLDEAIDLALHGLAGRALPPVRVDELLFPSAFPRRAAKRRGAVYTSSELVELVLDLVRWDGQGRLLEPSVGAGAFLLPAWDRSPGADLLGVDVHPFACRAARTALALRAAESGLEPPPVLQADALLAELGGSFDVVVGNPPWVRGERIPAECRAEYRRRQPDLGTGNVDLSAYFVRRALEWLRPGGRLGFVIPQGLLEARATAGLRSILSQHTVEAIVSLEWCDALFPGSAPLPAVLVVSKGAPAPGHRVRLGVAGPGEFTRGGVDWSEVEQRRWLSLGRQGRWPLLLREADMPFLEALAEAPRAVRAGYGLAIRTRVGAKTLIAEDPQALQKPRPLLDGREVRAWSLSWSGRYIDYRPEAISDPKSEDFFRAPKVLMPRIALTTQAAVDDRGYLARNTVMVLRAPETTLEDRPHALAALINSLPVRVYAFLLLRAGALAGSHRATFYAGVLGDLPIPKRLLEPGEPVEELEALGRQAHELAQAGDHEALALTETAIDAAVALAFGLDPGVVRARAAQEPLRTLLAPRRAGDRTRRIGVKTYALGTRYS